MDTTRIDHVNLRIPEDGVEQALAFYRDLLGMAVEGYDEFRADERPIFTFRVGPDAVIHVTPTDDFSSPDNRNFDHVAIVLEDSVDEIRRELSDAGVRIDREGTPRGAAGTAPAVYVRDPFGYRLELKETVHDS